MKNANASLQDKQVKCCMPLLILNSILIIFTSADYDECKTNPCGSGSVCTNLPGSYECSCPAGFVGDPTPNEGCVDVDECAIGSLCGESAECFNTPGSYFCQCPQGFTGNPKHRCEGIVGFH